MDIGHFMINHIFENSIFYFQYCIMFHISFKKQRADFLSWPFLSLLINLVHRHYRYELIYFLSPTLNVLCVVFHLYFYPHFLPSTGSILFIPVFSLQLWKVHIMLLLFYWFPLIFQCNASFMSWYEKLVEIMRQYILSAWPVICAWKW